MNRAIIYLIFCYLSINLLVAQTIQAEQDSLQQDRALVMLQRADSAHTRDSLQKELLRRQLGELSKTETTKRKKLELQLASLTQHDSLMRIAMKREVDSLKSI
ncbi:MAG: hypothetical protein RIS47_952, partial [Bacteroidota bacterium]